MRTLFILQHHTGVSLSVVADHLVLTLPSASKLVDGLVKRGFVMREMSDGRSPSRCLDAH